MRKLWLPLIALVAFQVDGASAGTADPPFDWTIPGIGFGTFDASPVGGGVFDVTNVTGTIYGYPITGLDSGYAIPDQQIYPGGPPFVDYGGVAFDAFNGTTSVAFNIFYDTSTTDDYACGLVGYCLIGPGIPGSTGLGPPRDTDMPITFNLVAATPLPAALPLFATGLGALGLFGWRRRRINAAALEAA
jgi:hypothetical protein